jgi:hypothetical protein
MMVTIRSSSSGSSSPALEVGSGAEDFCKSAGRPRAEWGRADAPLGEGDIGLLADKVGVTTTDTLDLGEGVLKRETASIPPFFS